MDRYIQKLNQKALFIPKAVYLIVNLQFYGFHQLRAIFAKEKFNISTEEYGKYTGYVQFITFFTSVLIGNLTDRTKQYQSSFLVLIVFSTLAFVVFYLDFITSLHKNMFWACLLFYLIFNNPKQPLLDKIIIEYLDKASDFGSKMYGKQRLWGSFALPIATYISEWCSSEGNGKYNYDNLLYYNIFATILSIGCVVLFYKLTSTSRSTQLNLFQYTQPVSLGVTQEKTANGSVFELLKNFEFMFFFVIIFLNAISRSSLTIYLQLFHKEILHIKAKEVPESWNFLLQMLFKVFFDNPISTLATAGVIFEIFILFISDKIIVKFGYFLPLIIAQVVALIRFLCYYLIQSSSAYVFEISCIIELLRGVYFGLIHISSVYIATKMAPQHLRTTSQMIYQGTFGALGFLLSGYIFGSMFQSKLSKELSFVEKELVYKQIFLVNMIISVITLSICIVKYGIIDKVLFNKLNEKKKLTMYD